MKKLLFAVAGYNLAETGRMIEIALFMLIPCKLPPDPQRIESGKS
jgi:hypothetical protein